MLPYWTKAGGIGGKIERPEDFLVKEIIHRKYFSKFSRKSKVEKTEGRYGIFVLRKRNLTTHQAVRAVSKEFGTVRIGFAGLKDKFAVTEQYITVEGGSGFSASGMELKKVGTTDMFLSKGDLLRNEFEIRLHGCRTENMEKAAEELAKKGFPNYFGRQRFGVNANNQAVGRLIVKRRFDEALEMINKAYDGKYMDIHRVPKDRLKFFVNAYQSWLFNKALAECVRKGKRVGSLPIVGFGTKPSGAAGRLASKEGIRPNDFMISDLKLACRGGKRNAFIKTSVSCDIQSATLLRFSLPPGSYATALLREICKEPWGI